MNHRSLERAASSVRRAKPPILAIAALLITSSAFALHASQSVSSKERPRLKRIDQPPTYVLNEGYDPIWPARVRKGIDITRAFLGNYGPVQVYVLGEQTDELDDESVRQAIIEAYCECRHADTPDEMPDCRSGPGKELIDKSRAGQESEAYLSFVDFTEPLIAELVFTNIHAMGGPVETRGIHEYTHVFQMSHAATPTWMMEGGAEFLASYLGSLHGWCEFESVMDDMLEAMAHRLREETEFKTRDAFYAQFGLHQMEDIDAATKEVKPYYWHLAYMTGSWAVAFIIHSSPSRSIKDFYSRFYELVDELGWQAALSKYTGFESTTAFYAAFNEFVAQSSEERRRVLLNLHQIASRITTTPKRPERF
ncbi:MAG: hypothetical protein ACI841_002769 [Planctomycetota bacterium]|jgi:hypothetical protein